MSKRDSAKIWREEVKGEVEPAEPEAADPPGRPSRGLTGLETLVVLALALAALSRFISPTPHIDEFYHVLAAQAWNADGTLVINEGGEPYTRARGFTYAVAASVRWFGDGWSSMRLPSLLAGGLLVAAVFAWLHRVAGRRAAWLGAVLMVLAPGVIGYSSMVRFYMPHALFVWLLSVCVYQFVAGGLSGRGRLVVLIFGLGCAAVAMHLQTTTAITALVLGVWAGTEFVGWLTRCEPKQCRRAAIWTVLVVLIVPPLIWLGFHYSGWLEHMQQKFQTPRLWSISHRYEYQYYHRQMNEVYPLLWAAFPFAAVVALATKRRAAWFCLLFFGLAFVIHSLMPFKSGRYLAYALPCFFALWAIALDGLLRWIADSARAVVKDVCGPRVAGWGLVSFLIGLLLLGGVLFALMVSPSHKLGRQMLTGETLGDQARENWTAAAEILEPIARETGFVVCSSPPKAVYYLGRHDVGLSVSQGAGREEFAVERIMGRPVITTVESVQQLMNDQASGLIVIEAAHFGARWYVPTETALFIESHTQPIEIPGATGVKAFRWGPQDALLSEPVTH